MIKEKLGHRLDGWIHALFPFLFWRRLHPDALTVIGAVVAGAAGLAYANGALALGGVLLLAGGFFDLVDGVVARHFGISTRFGALLDSSLDRVVDMLALSGLLVHFVTQGSSGWALVCVTILVASVLTSYAKARAELVLERMPGGLLERGERVGLLAAGSILGVLEPVLGLLAIGTLVTVGQRFLYAHREMRRMDEAERAAGATAGSTESTEAG